MTAAQADPEGVLGPAERRRTVAGAVLAVLAAVAGVGAYTQSPGHAGHDPQHSLQQLDLLYLDEPAPGAARLGIRPGSPALVVFCPDECALPRLEGAQVVRSGDASLAREYALGQGGRTGVALVDPVGHVRYRSYDPSPEDHETELQTLVDAVQDVG